MPIDNEVFEGSLEGIPWEEQELFIYCSFRQIEGAGICIEAAFIDCTFERCDFYLSMFNGATLVGVTFKNCAFHGGSIVDCRLVECVFDNCQFGNDNLGGELRLDGTRWYGCSQRGCEGLSHELVPLQTAEEP